MQAIMTTKFRREKKPFHARTITIVLFLAFVGNKCKMENSMFLNRRRKIQEICTRVRMIIIV